MTIEAGKSVRVILRKGDGRETIRGRLRADWDGKGPIWLLLEDGSAVTIMKPWIHKVEVPRP